MEFLYKDEHIVVCIKPSGLLSAKDASGKANMPSVIAEELGIKEVYPVHRLDKEVSGVMVFALTSKAAAKLSADVSDHSKFVKEYLALVGGTPKEAEGVFEDLLFKDSSKNKTFVVKKERRGVKKAKLEYKTVDVIGGKALVRVKLHTGRTHQIRVQFSSRGMPIVGDRKYGGENCDNGIMLFSVKLSFAHPITNEKLSFDYVPELLK